MKTLKRLSVLLVALAMILNVSGVFAYTSADSPFTSENPFKPVVKVLDENGNQVTSVKAGKTVNIAIYVPEGTYGSLGVAGTLLDTTRFTAPVNSDIAYGEGILEGKKSRVKNDITSTYGVSLEADEDDDGNPIFVKIDGDKPICIISINVGEGETDALNIMAFKAMDMTANTTDYQPITVADGENAKVAVLASFTATKAATESATATYEIGTDVAAELAKLPVTVKNADGTKTEGGYKAVWTTTATDLTVPTGDTPITFTGTVSDSQVNEDNAASWTGDLTATVAVTLTAIVGDSTDVEKVEKVEIRKSATALEAADITGQLPETLNVAKNGITDTVAVTWAVTPDATFGTVEGATLEATGTLAATSTNSKFTFAAKTVNATVKIIPATIENASIAIKSKSIYAKPQVTITVPASEVKYDDVQAGEDGEIGTEDDVVTQNLNAVVVTITDSTGDVVAELKNEAVNGNDFVLSEDGKTASYTITGEETLSASNISSGTVLAISATLNKAELVIGTEDVTGEDGSVTTEDVTSLEIKASKPSQTTPTGIPSNNSNNNQGNQTGTGSTGTTTPGTETPGTETPGTETPGTDAPVVEGPFEDVAADHWAAEAIATLKDAGIVGGVTATTFAPDADITRAEFTKMIAGLLKLDATSTEVAFEDCGADDWFTPYVAAAVEAGLVTGVSETEFAPDATITREQAFTIIGRATAAAEVNTTLTYADAAEISEYAVPYVTLLTQEGIVGGFADNTVRPQANITRAEAAKVIAGLMGIVVTEEEVAEEEAVDQTEEATTEEEAVEETVEEETVEE